MKKPTLRRNLRTKKEKLPSRITNETIAAHRESILAGGRRFKYPIQYARHKLVFNAIIVVVITLLLSIGSLLWLLYGAQNTSNFTYRITKVLPLPVATVDGASVRYSDYLRHYNSSTYYLIKNEQFNADTDDGKAEANYMKNKSLDWAIENAYAAKLAKELSITISDEELAAAIGQDRQASNGVVSDDTFARTAEQFYNLSVDEFNDLWRDSLLQRKVRFAIDQQAKDLADKVEQQVKGGQNSLEKLKKSLGDPADILVARSVPITLGNAVNPVIANVADRDTDKVYGPYQAALNGSDSEGYYFIKPLTNDGEVITYQYMLIPLHELGNRLDTLEKNGMITKYITIENQ